MASSAPRLSLHIGRNKAGSTTLRNYFAAHVDKLRAAGIDYVLFGQACPDGLDLPNFATHRDIAAFARARPGRSVLVSHEGLCCFSLAFTRDMATDLASLDTSVLFYIRPYREWVVSSYNFDVRAGLNSADFDAYLDGLSASVSVRPVLEIWGEALGWDRVRVRSLAPADLQGGNIATDALDALGLTAFWPAPAVRANMSPCWWVIEMLRLIAGGQPGGGWSTERLAIAEHLHLLIEQYAARAGVVCPPAHYLTRARSLDLANLYAEDLNWLKDKTGLQLQPEAFSLATDRAFLPSARHIPHMILRGVAAQAMADDDARLHPEAAAFVRSARYAALYT